MIFHDRTEAGRLLAAKLKKYDGNAVVYGLPRGGVETVAEVARELSAPLGLIIARKIAHPADAEYAVGAVTETGPAIWNEREYADLDSWWCQQAEKNEREEAKRRRQVYLPDHKPVSATGKTAIIVDDGIATGLTMQAAIKELKKQNPKRIIVAVPVAPPDAVTTLLEDADEVITLDDPEDFLGAVAAHYKRFPQLTDEDVIDILATTG